MATANKLTVNKIVSSLASLGLVMSLSVERVATATPQTPSQVNPIHVAVDLVQLNIAVTDSKGNYVTGLKPTDFAVLEDGIPQSVATFGEGNGPARKLAEDSKTPDGNTADPAAVAAPQPSGNGQIVSAADLSSLVAGANVFVLFDTSNYMYRGFVFAQDAISDFIRSLDNADRIAFYSYSRDLSRATRLTTERSQVLRGVRATAAGDNAALYNCLLLTVKDAAQYVGRKVIVVFLQWPG